MMLEFYKIESQFHVGRARPVDIILSAQKKPSCTIQYMSAVHSCTLICRVNYYALQSKTLTTVLTFAGHLHTGNIVMEGNVCR